MTKILITNTNISWNKGSAAQVISTVCSLRKFVPKAEFTLLSYCPKLDFEQCSKYDINIIGYGGQKYHKDRTLLFIYSLRLIITLLNCVLISLLQLIHLNSSKIPIKDSYTMNYLESDLILDLSGDSFSDWKNISIINILTLIPAILLKKPFVFFSQSIGPFHFWTLPFARFCLNKSRLIVIREDVTRNYFKQINVNNRNLFLAPDCAFLLEPAPKKRIFQILKKYYVSREERPRIGISVSIFMANKSFKDQANTYISVMAKLVDYIIENKKSYVMLIPHVIAPNDWGHDDVYAIRAIHKLLKNKNRVLIIDKNYDARELKGLIGSCDLFIGSRMHANIAALSQEIPTIAIGWSHKYYGIMKRLGMAAFVCYLKKLDFEELKVKVDILFSRREQIHKKLIHRTSNERNSAMDAIKLVRDLISNG